MKTDALIERVSREIVKSHEVRLEREEARLILNRLTHLESMAVELLRLQYAKAHKDPTGEQE